MLCVAFSYVTHNATLFFPWEDRYCPCVISGTAVSGPIEVPFPLLFYLQTLRWFYRGLYLTMRSKSSCDFDLRI